MLDYLFAHFKRGSSGYILTINANLLVRVIKGLVLNGVISAIVSLY